MNAEPEREEENVTWSDMATVYMIGGQVQTALVAAVLQAGGMAVLAKNSAQFEDFCQAVLLGSPQSREDLK
jgi:hypothetical protein